MKKLSGLSLCLIVSMMMFTATVANANLITNGSFEIGVYDDSAHSGYMRLDPGSTTLTGWTISGDGVDWHLIVGDNAHFGRNSVDSGQYAIDLALDSSPAGSISQDFATTPGTQYKLSFLLGAPWFDTAVNVTVANLSQIFYLAEQEQYDFDWALKTLYFTAVDSMTTLSFESISGGFWAPVIDNVVVELATAPVPEPSTMLLFGFGLVSFCCYKRRKM